MLNNCNLNKLFIDIVGYNFGSLQIKSAEFFDDFADPNGDKESASHWKHFVESAIFKDALLQLQVQLSSNRKTNHISYQYSLLKTNKYLIKLPLHLARLVFSAKTRMLDIKINYKRKYRNGLHCPFCIEYDETFDHIFECILHDSEYLNS